MSLRAWRAYQGGGGADGEGSGAASLGAMISIRAASAGTFARAGGIGSAGAGSTAPPSCSEISSSSRSSSLSDGPALNCDTGLPTPTHDPLPAIVCPEKAYRAVQLAGLMPENSSPDREVLSSVRDIEFEQLVTFPPRGFPDNRPMTSVMGALFSGDRRQPDWPQPPANSDSGPARARRSLRVMIADDDRDQVLTLTALLVAEGHQVRGLYRGKELVEATADFAPDVLILDIKLPDVSGFEIAEKIHERYRERRPLLIAISGVFKKGVDRILSQMAGFDHHLTKPFTFDALLALINPLARPPAGSTAQTLAKAAALIGQPQLAAQLNVTESVLDDWMQGRTAMPEGKLFLLAAILEQK